jgi:hypothetical protein
VVDVAAVVDVEDVDDAGSFVDAVHNPVGAAPGAVTASQRAPTWPASNATSPPSWTAQRTRTCAGCCAVTPPGAAAPRPRQSPPGTADLRDPPRADRQAQDSRPLHQLPAAAWTRPPAGNPTSTPTCWPAQPSARKSGTSPPGHHGPVAQDQRWALARSLLHDNGHDPGDRVAGLLVLLFGQRPGRIARLTTGHVSLDAERTTLTLGATPIRIPEPLASHLHDLARQRRHLSQVPAGGPGPWLFPGLHPGQPVLPATISHRLARIGIDTVTGRASALLQLAGELPPTVVADLLGLRPKTAIAWGQLAGRPWAAYPGLRDQRP